MTLEDHQHLVFHHYCCLCDWICNARRRICRQRISRYPHRYTSLLILTHRSITDSIKWDSFDHICIPLSPNEWIVLSSGMPLLAEGFVLALAAWNALDRSRAQGVNPRTALTEDGFLYFLVRGLSWLAELAKSAAQMLTLLRIMLLVVASRKDSLWFAIGIAYAVPT
jgi:hypothetical protein